MKTLPSQAHHFVSISAALLLALSLRFGPPPSAHAEETGAGFSRAFCAMLQSPDRDMRLQAVFHSVGLPEKAEYLRILRNALRGDDDLERLITLYALAVMTRAPEDVDAFLEAFPTDPWLFHTFFAAEWYLSGTHNQGVANFLLLLAHEPRTRGRALPRLARLAYTNACGPSEFLSFYREEPVVARYIEEHQGALLVAYPNSREPQFSPSLHWQDAIKPLFASNDPVTQMTAQLMAGLRLHFERTPEAAELQKKYPLPSAYGVLLERIFPRRDHDFVDAFPLEADLVREVLRMEKSLYRPPLGGYIGHLLAARSNYNEQTLRVLESALRHGKDYLEAYEIQRIEEIVRNKQIEGR